MSELCKNSGLLGVGHPGTIDEVCVNLKFENVQICSKGEEKLKKDSSAAALATFDGPRSSLLHTLTMMIAF